MTLTDEQKDALYAAMRGWARDLCLDSESPVEVVQRFMADAWDEGVSAGRATDKAAEAQPVNPYREDQP